MPTTREAILSALHALLRRHPAPVLRGEILRERVPAAGLLILRDGDPGEPAVMLSPLRCHYRHCAEVEAIVQAGTGRDAAFDSPAAGLGSALAVDRTLRGQCDWAEAEAPRPIDLAVMARRRLRRRSSRSFCITRAPIRSAERGGGLAPQARPCCRGWTGLRGRGRWV